ncbi:MAG: ATP-dependent sacrificial sulfur transferase LarE [Candidatus Omnitrophota bacterium]
MDKTLQKKLKRLKKILSEMESLLVAYSGGADSSLLLKVASNVLSDKVLAVTAESPTYPQSEINQAKKLANKLKIKHLIIKTDEFKNPNFLKNPADRCYYCKKELFGKLKKIAKKHKLNFVADGSNLDDNKDYRPGSKAVKEFKIRSPLKEARLTKRDIRELSKNFRLPTWDKPALACLASRMPYNEKITKKDLKKVQKAEEAIKKLGFKQVRVRHHKNLARIEVPEKEISKIINYRRKLIGEFKKIGYNYVCIDLQGYRTGSMNEALRIQF